MTLFTGRADQLDGFVRAVSSILLRMARGAAMPTVGLLPLGAFRSGLRLQLKN